MRPLAADAARDMPAARSPGGEAGAADGELQLKWADLLVSVPRGAPTPKASRTSFQPKPAAQAADVTQGGEPEAARLAALPASTSQPPPPEAAPPATEAQGQAGAVIIDKQPAEGTPAIRAVARDADAFAAALRDARAQAQHGELAAAAQTLQRHAAAGASHAEYRGLHAAVLQRLSVHAEAVEEYRAALRLAPNTSVWWLGLGISLEALGRTPQAREAFERARGGNLSAELAVFADQKLQTLR
jgi:tetratricopeptide (TPR) repeat protein